MDKRQKRSIVKPSRYQTTSSDKDCRAKSMKKTNPKNISDTLSQDINELREIFKDSSNIVHNIPNTQHTHDMNDTQTTMQQYLPSSEITSQLTMSQYTKMPMRTSYATHTNESQIEETASNYEFQSNENNYRNNVYTNLNEHYVRSLNNGKFVEVPKSLKQNNIDNRY